LIGSEKVRLCKNGTDYLCHHDKYGEDRTSRAPVGEKVICFYRHACPLGSMPLLRSLSGAKMGFSPRSRNTLLQ